MPNDIRNFINIFETEFDSKSIDKILNENYDNNEYEVTLIEEAIQKLEGYYIPPTEDPYDIKYRDGFYSGIDLSLNILKNILSNIKGQS